MILHPDLWQALLPVIQTLEGMDVPYHVGGSVASSYAGIARRPQDADLIADLTPRHAARLAAALAGRYYLGREIVLSGICHRSCFKVMHLETLYEIDVFVPQGSAFARANMARRMELGIPGLGRSIFFASPEDTVLHKLLWYKQWGEVSDRQWQDLLGVLKLQRNTLDRGYLSGWAEPLGLTALLRRALDEAGPTG
jgi:hypothetical protein